MAAVNHGGVLLLGIMQSGKSDLFLRLSSRRSGDAGAGGSTQALVEGRLRSTGARIMDTPGTATLFVQSEDEAVTRDALLEERPESLLVVLDQKNMRRSLALVLHAAEFGLPMVVAVNMKDEAIRHGIEVDYDRLAQELGVDVVPANAIEGEGTARILRGLSEPRVPNRLFRLPGYMEEALGRIGGLVRDPGGRGLGLLLLGGDQGAERLVREEMGEGTLRSVREVVGSVRRRSSIPPEVLVTDALYAAAESLARDVIRREPRTRGWLERAGRRVQHPAVGLPVAVLVVALMYLWVGKLGAMIIVDSINTYVFQGFLVPLCERLVAPIPSAFIRGAIVDPDFGLLPTGLFLAFGILMPVILFYYFALALLQQSGYLPRLSILLDRLLRLVGLNGKGVMPIVMGFSCITMALVTTRMLDSKKQRIIASMLLMLGLPCAPLLAVMLVILADLPLAATFTVFGIIGTQILLVGIVADRLLPGLQPDFAMVIPPMRIPRLRHALMRSLRQTYYFMREAVPFFLLAAFVLFVFDRIGGLALIERLASPVTNSLLGLPDSAVQVFIKTFIRRESGAAELNLIRGGFDNVQLVVSLLVMTFLTPCVNAMIMLAKERGLKVAAIIVGSASVYSLLVGGAVNHVLRLLGVTFS